MFVRNFFYLTYPQQKTKTMYTIRPAGHTVASAYCHSGCHAMHLPATISLPLWRYEI